jgi:hypothetical protein
VIEKPKKKAKAITGGRGRLIACDLRTGLSWERCLLAIAAPNSRNSMIFNISSNETDATNEHRSFETYHCRPYFPALSSPLRLS